MPLKIDHAKLTLNAGSPGQADLSLDDAVVILLLASLHKKGWPKEAVRAAEQAYNHLAHDLLQAPDDARAAAVEALRTVDIELLVHNGHAHGLFNQHSEPTTQPTLYNADIIATGQSWRVTSEHERSLRVIASEQDESLCIEGFSGTGKTTFTTLLSGILDPKTTLLLAQTPLQLDALKARVPGFTGATFAELSRQLYCHANNILPGKLGNRFRSSYALSHAQVASVMAYSSVGAFPPVRVAQIATSIVRRFCYQRHSIFTEALLPTALRHSLSPPDKGALVSYAANLWDATFSAPSNGQHLPVRGYHIMKWLNLNQIPIPLSQASHILIDEAHDVPPTMLSILDSSPGAVISLGDRFQYFGDHFAPRRGSHIRAHQFRQSVRTDRNVGRLLNEVLLHHPQAPTSEFIGNPDTKVTEQPYERLDQEQLANFVHRKGTRIILSAQFWTVATTIQRLAAMGAPFRYTGSTDDLQLLIADAERLYRGTAEFVTHPMLINHISWAALKRQAGSAILALENLFARGFTAHHFEASMNSAKDAPALTNSSPVLVGLIEHAKNREYDHVLITTDVRYGHYQDPISRGSMISALYTGLTRAKHTISYQHDMIDKMMQSLNTQPAASKSIQNTH